jgi:hypothetical protein
MLLRQLLRQFPRIRRSVPKPARARSRRVRLFLEGLEDRTVPTVVFQPQFGNENFAASDGATG